MSDDTRKPWPSDYLLGYYRGWADAMAGRQHGEGRRLAVGGNMYPPQAGSHARFRWWVHNLVAHPLMVLWPRVGDWLHDKTAPEDPTP